MALAPIDPNMATPGTLQTHTRTLFQRFGVGDRPANQKRLRLAELAPESGVLSLADLEG